MSDNQSRLCANIAALLTNKSLTPLPISTAPLIEGRRTTRWIMENSHKLHKHELYDQSLTEDDLRKIVDDRPDISLPHGKCWAKGE